MTTKDHIDEISKGLVNMMMEGPKWGIIICRSISQI